MKKTGGSFVKGSYLGDVTALSFIRLPWPSTLPGLLAGTGPHLFLHDLVDGRIIFTSTIFDGIRIHGIHVLDEQMGNLLAIAQEFCNAVACVAIHGERRVKLFFIQPNPSMGKSELASNDLSITLWKALPRFAKWVLDVKLLQENIRNSGAEIDLLAVGLSDNSVHVWSLQSSEFIYKVQCAEKCLLYSMSFYGCSINDLQIAAGTIFNEVILWKLQSKAFKSLQMDTTFKGQASLFSSRVNIEGNMSHQLPLSKWVEESPPIQRFIGHEGSIYQISWSGDGLRLASVSDDRSARVWTISVLEGEETVDPSVSTNSKQGAQMVLYGHSARIWDCYIDDKILVTASEDCSCCIWTSDGELLASLKGHTGRGVWRCIFDAESGILVTGGADASIKVLSLSKWVHKSGKREPDAFPSDQSIVLRFSLSGAKQAGKVEKRLNSKSEYVRCLALGDPSLLYIGTNHGFIYAVKIKGEDEIWQTLKEGSGHVPLVCMDVLANRPYAKSQVDWIVAGDGEGNVTVIENHKDLCSKAIFQCSWSAEEERQLLGVFWCPSLGSRYVFTTDPRGCLRCWYLSGGSHENIEPATEAVNNVLQASTFSSSASLGEATLLAVCKSELNCRIVCLDVSVDMQIVVCGDQQGSLVLFKLPCNFFKLNDLAKGFVELPSEAVLKGAHGISAVASVLVTCIGGDKQMKICSTGRDGCICTYICNGCTLSEAKEKAIYCVSVEKVTVIRMVESFVCFKGVPGRSEVRRVATGFAAADFVIWDLTNEIEILRVPCGGWRRPHSYLIGEACENQHCFVFTKDEMIHVYHCWTSEPTFPMPPSLVEKIDQSHPNSTVLPCQQSLHKQFHGKEIHSVQFVPVKSTTSSNRESWIVTGSEDGSVRVTRCSGTSHGQLDVAMNFGEHVGGSAVRAITLVVEFHTLGQISGFPDLEQHEPLSGEACDFPKVPLMLLLSAGAKEVLTCWKLEWVAKPVQNQSCGQYSLDVSGAVLDGSLHCHEQRLASTWLSSHVPSRSCKPSALMHEHLSSDFKGKSSHADSVTQKPGLRQTISKPEEQANDSPREEMSGSADLRYLSLTAISVCFAVMGSTVCFIIAASSNATLNIHAFDISTRTWFKVAVLEYHLAPVLVVRHIVITCPKSDL